MRLIDADALMLKICGEGCGCMPDQCGYPCCDIGGNEKRCRTGEYVENAPTIPAIPVEWLEQQRDKRRAAAAAHSNISSMTVLEAINVVLELWQKEQEGQ